MKTKILKLTLDQRIDNFLKGYERCVAEAYSNASLLRLAKALKQVNVKHSLTLPTLAPHPTQGYVLTKGDGKRVAFQSRAEAQEQLRFELSLGGAL